VRRSLADDPDMSLEIERKFLVANEGWKTAVTRRVRIRDGLIANNKGNKARVRIADDVATIALKSRRRGEVCTEFEYAIPYADAEEMLRTMCDGHVLGKVRHFVSHAGNNWYVDVYEGVLNGVVLAEIELTDAGQEFALPDWIGAEVTSDPRYRKINMIADRIASQKPANTAALLARAGEAID
jgi:adenylate cyclase